LATIQHSDRAASISAKLAKMRVRMGSMGAYGEKAEQLDLGKRTPPSGRNRGAPAAVSTKLKRPIGRPG